MSTVIRMETQLTNIDTLKKALTEMNIAFTEEANYIEIEASWNPIRIFNTGKIICDSASQSKIEHIKNVYAKIEVEETLKELGYTNYEIKETADKIEIII